MGYDMHLSRRRLDNGMTMLVSRNRRLPLISINAFLLAGSDQNPRHRPGLAELTSRLLDEGSRTHSSQQISRQIEDEGASLSIFSSREIVGIGFQALSQSLDKIMNVLYEILANPVFPQAAFDRERDRLIGDLLALEDDPRSVAGRLFNRIVYRGTPFEHPFWGTLEGVQGTCREEVVKFHKHKYAPENTILVAVGDVDADRFEEAAERFSDWQNPNYDRQEISHPVRQSAAVSRRKRLDCEQLQIALGHLGVTRLDPDYHALQVLDLILGSGPGFTSRIPRVLRDELGLAYLTYGNITASAGIYPGQFICFISTSPENKRQALKRLRKEIIEVIDGKFSEDELATAKDFLTGNFVFDFESNYNVARFLLTTELFGLGTDYPDRYPELVRRVTHQDVERVASRHLDPVNCTTVVVGPFHSKGSNGAGESGP